MKKLFKFTGYTLGVLILLLMIYFLAAFSLSRISTPKEPDTHNEVTIYILTNGVHTDIVVPAKTSHIDWREGIRHENTLANDTTAQFLAFGWGDKGFYLETPTWADLKFSVAFKAAFGLSTSAIHATYYRNMKEGENCKSIQISQHQYERLVQYIKKSLQFDEGGRPIYIETNANYGASDAFYEATGSYFLFHTCNTWANNALKSCGQKASLWTPFDTGIFYHYK